MITRQEVAEEIRQHMQAHTLVVPGALSNEQPGQVQQALPSIIDLVLNSLAEMVGQPASRDALWQAVQEAHAPGLGAGYNSAVAARPGQGLVKEVLSDRYHGTMHSLATATGLAPTAATQLLDAATTAALEVLGEHAAAEQWNAARLAQWLRPYHTDVAEPLAAAAVPLAASQPAARPRRWLAERSNVLLLTVSVIAVAELGYIIGLHTTANDTAATTAPAAGSAASPATATRPYTAIPVANLAASRAADRKAAVPVVLKLKNGLRQVIGASSTESKLYQFLIDPSKEVNTTDPTQDWIGFDRIYFDTNKATLTNESLWQLSNVASILKRFPGAKIKIGGYTDSSGQPLTNLQLSKARAQAALDALTSLGVPAERLTAVGYGAIDPIASNDTEEGRAVNRRVSMQVVQK